MNVTHNSGDVVIMDDVLPTRQCATLHDFLHEAAWRFGWKSASKTDQFSFWHAHFAGHRKAKKEKEYPCADELATTAPLVFEMWEHLHDTVFAGHTLVRCYANAHSYGTDGTIHTDSKKADSHTAVYYPHDEWLPNWAGETVIFNDDRSDIIAAVYPRPNRMAIFRGNSPHVARGVSRTCPVLRITLMFKTRLEP